METELDRMIVTSVIKPVDFLRMGFPYRPSFKEKWSSSDLWGI